MSPNHIDRTEGKQLFGHDPGAYDAVRPPYPGWIFESLIEHRCLFPGARVLEIGPGTGSASRALLQLGAAPLICVEPDERFHDSLRALSTVDVDSDTSASVEILSTTFEETTREDLDLIVAATSFHWIDPDTGWHHARRLLRPGGTLALFWNTFQVLGAADAFHDATTELLSPLAASPSGAPDTLPYALDRDARIRDASTARFALAAHRQETWTYTLDAEGIGSLYAGFSGIQRLPTDERQDILSRLQHIARHDFGDRVERNMTSTLYLFQ